MPEPIKGKETSDIGSPEWLERYSRQTLLSGVGVEGQKRWANALVRVAGEGDALEACLTALASSGIGNLQILRDPSFDSKSFGQFYPQTKIEVIPDLNVATTADLTLVVTARADLRRKISRQLRSQKKIGIFAWPAASGFALWVGPHAEGKCPCLECFRGIEPQGLYPRLTGSATDSGASGRFRIAALFA